MTFRPQWDSFTAVPSPPFKVCLEKASLKFTFLASVYLHIQMLLIWRPPHYKTLREIERDGIKEIESNYFHGIFILVSSLGGLIVKRISGRRTRTTYSLTVLIFIPLQLTTSLTVILISSLRYPNKDLNREKIPWKIRRVLNPYISMMKRKDDIFTNEQSKIMAFPQ